MSNDFGKQIKQFRELTGKSAQDLADDMGVTASTVRRWEAGTIKILGHHRAKIEAMIAKAAPVVKESVDNVTIVVDRSTSMMPIWSTIQRLHTKLVEDFRASAEKMGRTINLATITFADDVRAPYVTNDIGGLTSEALRRSHNIDDERCSGWTALWDAVGKSIELSETTERTNRETSHLVIVLTDGEENRSHRYNLDRIKTLMAKKTATDAWTFTFQVPPRSKQMFCNKTDVPEGNVIEWEATERGANSTFQATSKSAQNYLVARAQGMRSSTSFYTTDMASLSKSDIKSALRAAQDVSAKCSVISAPRDCEIKPLIESKVGAYRRGAAFYQLVKRESAVQDYKKLIVTEIGKPGIFCGTSEIRELLGLPQRGTVKIVPGDHAGFEIFVQSTSVNRKIPAGTKVIHYPGAAA